MSGYMGMSMEEFKNDSSLQNQQATLLDEKCIEKANEVLTELSKFKDQLESDKQNIVNEAKKNHQLDKEDRLQLIKMQV